MSRRYAEWELDEAVLADQDRRHEARKTDPRWQLVEADDGLGGLVWRMRTEDTTMTLAEIITIHQEAQGPSSASVLTPKGAAVSTVSRLKRELAALSEADRADVLALLRGEVLAEPIAAR